MAYLRQEEKQRSRELWDEAFPEDSQSFRDYYYKEKTRDNRILATEEDGRIVSMLHLNPYRVMVKKQIWRSDYIVGVATTKDKRHQGHMRALLTEMLGDMYQEGRQFCFLMPADEEIYRPFDFVYIFDQPHWVLKNHSILKEVPYDLIKSSEHHPIQEVADWMNTWLHSRYEVYAFRDEAYVKRLMEELHSEDGEMTLLYNDERLVGIRCRWGIEEKEQRMLLCEEVYMEEEKPATPAIMARIINLQNFIKIIGLKRGCGKEEVSVKLTVSDELCCENAGTYLWHLRRDGSVLEKLKESPNTVMAAEAGVSLTISELTAWLFGSLIPAGGNWMEWVQPLQGVFLDEVV